MESSVALPNVSLFQQETFLVYSVKKNVKPDYDFYGDGQKMNISSEGNCIRTINKNLYYGKGYCSIYENSEKKESCSLSFTTIWDEFPQQ